LVDCWLPYGDTEIYVSINLEDYLGTLTPKKIHGEEPLTLQNEIQTGLDEPISGPTISELVKPNCKATITVDGTMNPVLAVEGLKIIISRLVDLIVTKDNMTILLGNGEREHSGGKILEMIKGDPSLGLIKFLNNTKNSSNYSDLGETVRGTPVRVRKEHIGASLKISIGQVEIDPHTGFKGAFSAVIPGISSQKTVESNRKNYFKGDIQVGKIDNNPIKEDALEIVDKTGIDFALNFAVDYDGTPLTIQAGSYEESWRRAINYLGNSYEVKSTEYADITIVSAGGFCHDFNLYRSLWALENASKVTKRNGTIILAAECNEGLGAEAFTILSRVRELSEFERRYTYGAEVLRKLKQITIINNVILVSSLPMYLTEPLELISARTLNEAYENATSKRRGRKTLVIPYGCTAKIVK
jgi:nickel-dependent lactate racemase